MRRRSSGFCTMARCARLAVLGIAALTPPAAFGFEGRVQHPDGSPVPDATVTILGRPGASRTDAQGRFVWAPDPPLPFDLLVALHGDSYAAPIRIGALPADGPLVVTISATAAESVTVTADAAPHIGAPPASALNLLAREDLQSRRPQRLSDALENIPGAGRLGHGHDAVPSIRGLARGRTLFLLDGARLTSERRAGVSGTFLDPFFLEAIEVSRGPGSVTYGSDAFGGVIHARTRRARPGDPLVARLEGNLGEGVPERSAGVEISRGLSEGGFLFQGRYRSFDNYDSPRGEIPNAREDAEYGLLARFDHEAGPGSLSLSWQGDAVRGMQRPSALLDDLRVSQPQEDSQRISLGYHMDPLPAATLLSFSGFVGRYRLVTDQEFPDPNTAAPLTSRSDVRAKDYGLRAHAIQPLGGARARLEGGLDLNGRIGLEAIGSEPAGRVVSIEDAERHDTGIYLSGEVALRPALSISSGVRYDRVATRNHGGLPGSASTDNEAISGYAAVTAGPFAGVSLTAQAARGFRDPTLSDRYFSGPTGRGVVTGDPDLTSETSRQLDAAVRFSGRRLRWGAYGYHYRIEDLVTRVRGGLDPLGRRIFFFENSGEATLRGLELEATLQLEHGLRLELGAQSARGEADDGAALDDVPGAGVTLVVRKTLRRRGFLLARAGLWAEDDRPGPSELRTPGYGTLDLGGGLALGEHLELRLIVRNVADHAYPAGSDETAVLAAGRAALLTLTGRIGG